MSTFPDSVQRLTIAKLTVGELLSPSGISLTPKQGAVTGSDYTATGASYANVTGCEVKTSGAAIIIATAQVVAAASVTTAQLQIATSAGAITGVWLAMVDTASAGDITNFGAQLGAVGPNLAVAATYDVMFVGWVSAAATVDLQGKSDGTRTLTVKVGSQIASST